MLKKKKLFLKQHTFYSKKCKNLTKEQIRCYEQEGRKPVIRFSVPDKHIEFDDIVRGKLDFDTGLFGDFVIMKSKAAFQHIILLLWLMI